MSDSDDDKQLGARKAEVKAEKKQKDDESDDDKPLGKLKKESACSKTMAASDDVDEESEDGRESGDEDGKESGDEDEESEEEYEESEDKAEQVELRLRVREEWRTLLVEDEAEDIVRVRPDSVDLTARTGWWRSRWSFGRTSGACGRSRCGAGGSRRCRRGWGS
jgi:hypothetical protein